MSLFTSLTIWILPFGDIKKRKKKSQKHCPLRSLSGCLVSLPLHFSIACSHIHYEIPELITCGFEIIAVPIMCFALRYWDVLLPLIQMYLLCGISISTSLPISAFTFLFLQINIYILQMIVSPILTKLNFFNRWTYETIRRYKYNCKIYSHRWGLEKCILNLGSTGEMKRSRMYYCRGWWWKITLKVCFFYWRISKEAYRMFKESDFPSIMQ